MVDLRDINEVAPSCQLVVADDQSLLLLASWNMDVLHRLHQSALSGVSELGLQPDFNKQQH